MIPAVRRGVVAALIVSLVAAATAWADETISTRPVNSFSASLTTIDQGEKVTLQNMDVAGHDVVSEKARGRQQAPVPVRHASRRDPPDPWSGPST